ncbi:MAG: EF-hand domain-containing protein [Rhodobacterales bacterium]
MNGFVKTTVISAIVIGSLGAAFAATAHKGPGMLAQRFDEIDTNSDGFITKDEMAAHHNTEFSQKDTDGDGALSKAEVKAAMMKRMQMRLDRMFARMDKDKDGKIAQSEMKKGGAHMFKRLDADKDGKISKAEVENMHGSKMMQPAD